MIWIKIENIKRVSFYISKNPNLMFISNKEDLNKAIKEKKDVISPFTPKDFNFSSNYGFFNLIEDNSIPEEIKKHNLLDKYLEDRLSLKVIYPKTTFNDLGGAGKLKEDIKYFQKLEKYNNAIGGLFLFGVPGAGKSFFAECFAGETKRILIDLDLTKISFDDNPSDTLNKIVEFLLSKKERYVLWIDEIEKMINPDNPKAMQIFGRLLTLLNDINKENIKELVFIVTANRIDNIVQYNPEFLRKGRFRKLYFLNFPSMQNAQDIFKLYINKNLKKVKPYLKNDFYKKIYNIWDMLDYIEMLKYIDNFFYQEKIENTFIYSPAEIKTFAEELFYKIIFNIEETGNFNVDIKKEIENTVKEIIPLQLSMKEGILNMISQKLSFNSNLDLKIYEEIS